MEIKQLLFFKLTAEMEHMTKAAEKLLVSQPFLSKTISELESEIGVKLFDHIGRNIVLNEYGAAFYRHVVKMFNEYDDALNELKDMSNNNNNKIIIATNVSLYLPSLLKSISNLAPEITVQQYSARRFKIIKLLQNNHIDFAVITPPLKGAEYKTNVLMNELGVIIYPHGHWLSNYKEISMKEVVNEPFISVAPGYGTRDSAEDYLKLLNINLKIYIETSDTSSIFEYVKHGMGIALAPKSLVLSNPFFSNHYVNIVKPSISTDIGLTRNATRYANLASRTFSDLTISHFRQY